MGRVQGPTATFQVSWGYRGAAGLPVDTRPHRPSGTASLVGLRPAGQGEDWKGTAAGVHEAGNVGFKEQKLPENGRDPELGVAPGSRTSFQERRETPCGQSLGCHSQLLLFYHLVF